MKFVIDNNINIGTLGYMHLKIVPDTKEVEWDVNITQFYISELITATEDFGDVSNK
jgi:hypothetical protein